MEEFRGEKSIYTEEDYTQLMKASTAAFWMLMVLILIIGIVFVTSIVKPNDANLEIIKLFTSVMERIIILIGGGWLGAKIGESEKADG